MNTTCHPPLNRTIRRPMMKTKTNWWTRHAILPLNRTIHRPMMKWEIGRFTFSAQPENGESWDANKKQCIWHLRVHSHIHSMYFHTVCYVPRGFRLPLPPRKSILSFIPAWFRLAWNPSIDSFLCGPCSRVIGGYFSFMFFGVNWWVSGGDWWVIGPCF